MKKKFFWVFFSLSILVYGAFYYSLWTTIFDYAWKKNFPNWHLQLEKCSIQNFGLHIESLHLNTPVLDFEAKDFYIGWKLEARKLKIYPYLQLDEALFFTKKYDLKTKDQVNLEEYLNFLKISTSIDIKNGCLENYLGDKCFFSVKTPPTCPEIKKIIFTFPENLALDSKLELVTKWFHEEYFFNIDFFNFDLNRLQKIIPAGIQKEFGSVDSIFGKVSGQTSFRLTKKGQIIRSSIQLEMENIEIITKNSQELKIKQASFRSQSQPDSNYIFDQPLQFNGALQFSNLDLKLDHQTNLSASGKIGINTPIGHKIDIKGNIEIGQDQAQFCIKGKNLSIEDKAPDLLLELTFLDKKLNSSTADFLFSSFNDKLWTISAHIEKFPADYLSIIQKSFISNLENMQRFECQNGRISMKAIATLQGYKFQKIDVCDLHFFDISLSALESNLVLNLHDVKTSLEYDVKNKILNHWTICSKGCDIEYKQKNTLNIKAKNLLFAIEKEGDFFKDLQLTGFLQNRPINIYLTKNIASSEVVLEYIFSSYDLGYNNKENEDTEYRLVAKIFDQLGRWRIQSSIFDTDDILISCEGVIPNIFRSYQQSEISLEHLVQETELHRIEGRNIDQKLYSTIIKGLKLPWELEGKINLNGSFISGKLNLDLEFQSLSFCSDEIYFQQELKKDEQRYINSKIELDCLNQKFFLSVPLEQGICLHKETNLWFEDVQGLLTIIDTKLYVKNLSLISENLFLKGELTLEFLEEKPLRLEISANEVNGKMVNLQRLARHFPEFQDLNVPFDGDLKSTDNPFSLNMALYPEPQIPEWNLKVKVEKGEFYDFNIFQVNDVEFELILDSSSPYMEIKNLIAQTEFQSKKLPYHISADIIKISMQKDIRTEFQLKLESGFLEIAKFSGNLEFNEENLTLNLLPNEFIKEWIPFIKEKNIWKKGGVVFHFNPFQLHQVFLRLSFLSTAGNYIFQNFLSGFKDTEGLDISCFVNDDNIIKCKMMSYEYPDKEFFDLEALWDGTNLDIKKANFQDFKSDCYLRIYDQNIDLKYLNFQYKNSKINFINSGYDFVNQIGSLNIDNLYIKSYKEIYYISSFFHKDFDFSIKFSGKLDIDKDNCILHGEKLIVSDLWNTHNLVNSKKFTVNFQNKESVEISELDIKLEDYSENQDLFNFSSQKFVCSLKENRILSESCHISISPECIKSLPIYFSQDLIFESESLLENIKNWDNSINADITFSIGPEKIKCQGKLQDGYYWINNQTYFFQDVKFDLMNSICKFEGKCNFLDYPFAFSTEFNLQERTTLVVDFSHQKAAEEKAKAIFFLRDEKPELLTFYGTFCGVNFYFHPQKLPCAKNENIFTVGVDLNLIKIIPFLPKDLQEKLKLIKVEENIFLKGNLLLNLENLKDTYFKGFISSKNTQIQDVIIQDIQGLVSYDEGKLKIEDFSIADSAILAKIDQLIIELIPDKFLDFSLKNLHVYDFRPSLINKVNQAKVKIKPLMIRNLHIDEIKGNFKNQEKIEGKGYLQFINTFKRENHLIDIPREIISRLGLDIGLLVPVRGEIDLEIKDKKILLKDLRNAFSDGKRSHFYFPSNTNCFIDFDGNIHIDIKMKQYVLFKITQPFVLSLRGNLAKPSFSLK